MAVEALFFIQQSAEQGGVANGKKQNRQCLNKIYFFEGFTLALAFNNTLRKF